MNYTSNILKVSSEHVPEQYLIFGACHTKCSQYMQVNTSFSLDTVSLHFKLGEA